MMETVILNETVDENRVLHLALRLPVGAPEGKVRVTIEPLIEAVDPIQPPEGMTEEEVDALFEEAMELLRQYPQGQGLTMGEILKSPQIGMWANRTDIGDSVEYVARTRRESQERRMNRD
jgi:hypothetical protein